MTVRTVLQAKGHQVETTRPETTIDWVIHRLTAGGIGALVVSSDGEQVEGVISERDVVRGLARHGDRLLGMRAAEVMSRGVPVCAPHDRLADVMAAMTRSRQRHLPVIDAGKLAGIVSIGDVVKSRLEELELETVVLREAYIAHR